MNRYEKYKPSGIDWIGDIPDHWNLATIGRISNLGRGRVISAIEIGENSGEYPVYSSQTESNGIMGYLNSYDFDGEYVTWTTDGANAGTVFYREGKFNCTNVCGTIQPKNWEQIDLRYLPYFLNLGTKYSVRLDINPKLMNNMMAKIPFAIPTKEEQTAIANYLDNKIAQIDLLIANKQRLIELLKEEKTSVVEKTVKYGINSNEQFIEGTIYWFDHIPKSWIKTAIKYVARESRDSIVDGPFGSSVNVDTDYVPDGIPVIRTVNITEKGFNEDDLRFMSVEKFNELKRHAVYPGDILFSKVGTIGNCCIFPSHIPQGILSTTGSCKITVNPELIINEYLVFLLRAMKEHDLPPKKWTHS